MPLPRNTQSRRAQVARVLRAAQSAGYFESCRDSREVKKYAQELLGAEFEDVTVGAWLVATHGQSLSWHFTINGQDEGELI